MTTSPAGPDTRDARDKTDAPPARRDEAGAGGRGPGAARLMREAIKGDPDRAPYVRRHEHLKKIRKPMEPVWREIRDYLLPVCGRFLDGDEEEESSGKAKTVKSCILDSSPTTMARVAAEGLHGGLTNQAEQWFSLYVGSYRDYRESVSEEAKAWITNAQNCERDTLATSNFYSAIYPLYLEAFGFGTAVMLILSDAKTRVRYYSETVGTYWLGQDDSRRIDSLYLKSMVRAIDLIEKYGEKNCPRRVVEAVRDKQEEQRFGVIRCIQPWNYFGQCGRHPRWTYESVCFVEGGDEQENILCREGFLTKPFVAIRWTDSGDYVYGQSCPGIDCLPDVKQLQVMTLDYNMAVKWASNPAWVHSVASRIDGKTIIPGGIYQVDGNVRDNLLAPLVPPAFNIPANTEAAAALRERISATLYNREILLVQSRERQITATEVNQLIAEKNAVLGPITARMGDNALIPILDRTFEIITEDWHILSEAPEEIQGMEVKPYFSGQLAKAQRQGGTLQQIEYTMNIAAGLGNLDPQALANFDWSGMLRAADEVDLFLPGTIRPQKQVEEMQAQQQQALAQQQQAAALVQTAATAKDLGGASTAPDTALGMLAGAGRAGQAAPA